MSEKRKDSKGRILRTGESQRSDGRYQYRYKDIHGERRVIYDWDLHSAFDGNIPLSELIDRAYALKRNWDESTKSTMNR